MRIDSSPSVLASTVIGAGMILGIAESTLACTVTGGAGSPNDISSNLAPGVTLTVTGKCIEDVVITQDDVTIESGVTNAVIRSRNPADSHDAIVIDGAKRVTLRRLVINRGRYGVKAQGGASFRLLSSTVANAQEINVYVFDGSTAHIRNSRVWNAADSDGVSQAHGIVASRSAHMIVEKTIVSGNSGWGIVAAKGSHAEVIDSTVENNTEDAAFAARNASMTIENGTFDGNGYGIGSFYGSSVEITGATITNNAGASVDVFSSSNGDLRDTNISSDVDSSSGDVGIYVTHGSALRLQDTSLTFDAGTLGAQTCCYYGIFVGDNSDLDMREGNTISTNIEDLEFGATIAVHRNSNVRTRGGTDPTETSVQFNRIINTAPIDANTCNWRDIGGTAIDLENLSYFRIDSGHTKIEGNLYQWNLSSLDVRDANIKGTALADDPSLSRMRFRDQGTVVGNVTLETGKLCHFGGGVTIRGPASSTQPTFDADIDCNGSTFMPGPPVFLGGHGFINCP